MSKGIGLFLCKCGPNIADKLDMEAVTKSCQELENVSAVKTHDFLCSVAGKEFLVNQIKSGNFDRIVIAACSPREREPLFRSLCEEAGINPYLMQMTNIREQCAWVTESKEAATEKAKALVKAAVQRVVHHQELDKKELDCVTDILIIGGGVAGIEAALLAAKSGRKVYIVEKEPSIGGNVMKYEDLAPTLECSSCLMAPRLSAVNDAPNIEVITNTTIQKIAGFFGNFIVHVQKKARFISETECTGCTACFEVCPVSVPNKFHKNLGKRKAIYQLFPGSVPNVAMIDSENCLKLQGKECNACTDICPFGALQFDQKNEIRELNVGAIIVATGTEEADANKTEDRYGYGKHKNVYTGTELELLANSNGPTGGKITL
ncbi:MAG: FAD-dependent oxidoreductase, partial [Planctomycetota bacterium]